MRYLVSAAIRHSLAREEQANLHQQAGTDNGAGDRPHSNDGCGPSLRHQAASGQSDAVHSFSAGHAVTSPSMASHVPARQDASPVADPDGSGPPLEERRTW